MPVLTIRAQFTEGAPWRVLDLTTLPPKGAMEHHLFILALVVEVVHYLCMTREVCLVVPLVVIL